MKTKKNPAAVALGRKGGRMKSEAKASAVRENGKRGGRPKIVGYEIQRRHGKGWRSLAIPMAFGPGQKYEAEERAAWMRDPKNPKNYRVVGVSVKVVQREEFSPA